MRKQWIATCLLLAVALTGPSANRATAQWEVSGYPSINSPLPLGPSRADTGGFYAAAEFLFMHQDRALGSQVIASRGFRDSDGSLTGTPGQFVGSNRIAITTSDLVSTTWTPGFRTTIGYRLEDGMSFSVSYAHLIEAKYNFSA